MSQSISFGSPPPLVMENLITEKTQCQICFDPFSKDRPSLTHEAAGTSDKTKKVFHTFHEDCLKPWLSKTPKCPYCKRTVINLKSLGLTEPVTVAEILLKVGKWVGISTVLAVAVRIEGIGGAVIGGVVGSIGGMIGGVGMADIAKIARTAAGGIVGTFIGIGTGASILLAGVRVSGVGIGMKGVVAGIIGLPFVAVAGTEATKVGGKIKGVIAGVSVGVSGIVGGILGEIMGRAAGGTAGAGIITGTIMGAIGGIGVITR